MKMLVISTLDTFISFYLFGKFVYWDQMYRDFGFSTNPTMIGLLIFFQYILGIFHCLLVFIIKGPINHVLSFLMNMLSRKHEFQADSFAKKMGYSGELASGLIKLNVENLGNMNPDPWYSTYHYSHPPLLERLKAVGAVAKKSD
jgi:STE24 endopeptidase